MAAIDRPSTVACRRSCSAWPRVSFSSSCWFCDSVAMSTRVRNKALVRLMRPESEVRRWPVAATVASTTAGEGGGGEVGEVAAVVTGGKGGDDAVRAEDDAETEYPIHTVPESNTNDANADADAADADAAGTADAAGADDAAGAADAGSADTAAEEAVPGNTEVTTAKEELKEDEEEDLGDIGDLDGGGRDPNP